jgi:hypothetical protein
MMAGMLAALVLPALAHSEGLFENSGSEESVSASTAAEPAASTLTWNGYVKGAFYGGRDSQAASMALGSYGQAALKLNAKKGDLGSAFAEIRLNAGDSRGQELPSSDLREAWAAISPGIFDVKIGRQIISWGRADALNPTNNLTPKDELVLSSENDDTRLGNELVQLGAKLGAVDLHGFWIPRYRPDVLPLAGADLPAGITLVDPVYPESRLLNSGYAVRLDFNHPAIDGSLSYFDGYATLPGFNYSLGMTGLSLVPQAYRMQVIGADFSTTAGSFGLRGEAAYKQPVGDYQAEVWMPNPCGQFVAGIDRSVGNLNILLQYSGLVVADYQEMAAPDASLPLPFYMAAMARNEIENLNRLFTGTKDQFSHSVTANVKWDTLYETLHFGLAGMYNFTTRDYVVNPSVTYDMADATSLTFGGRQLDGPEGSLNHMVNSLMSQVYTELKMSF